MMTVFFFIFFLVVRLTDSYTNNIILLMKNELAFNNQVTKAVHKFIGHKFDFTTYNLLI